MFIINYPHIVINLGKIFKVILFVFPIILILSSLEAILTSVSLTTLFPIVNDIINKNDGVVNNSFLNFLSLDQRSLILFFSLLITPLLLLATIIIINNTTMKNLFFLYYYYY